MERSPPAVERDVIGGSPKAVAWRAQQADALVGVAKAYLEGGGAADEQSGSADHYQVVVHVDEQSLRGGAAAPTCRSIIKRLCCDSGLVTVFQDASGTPLDVGRKQRRDDA